MADHQHLAPRQGPSLSPIFSDPFVANAFRRAERDNGDTFADVPVRPITLAGGAAEPMEAEYA
jgi:hypothetical protein